MLYLYQIEVALKDCRKFLPTKQMQKQIDNLLSRIEETKQRPNVPPPDYKARIEAIKDGK